MAGYVPQRYTGENIRIYLSPVIHGGIQLEAFPLLGPASIKLSPSKIYGPARDVEIDEAIAKVNRTGAGDQGPFEMPARKGPWRITIEALIDCRYFGLPASGSFPIKNPNGSIGAIAMDPSVGDNRWSNVLGWVVEFLIQLGSFDLVYGVGLFEGRITIPGGTGESVIRNASISRVYPNHRGNLLWANLETGVFDTFDSRTQIPTYPPPIVR